MSRAMVSRAIVSRAIVSRAIVSRAIVSRAIVSRAIMARYPPGETCVKQPDWPASAAQAADWPRLAEAPGSLRHALALRDASGEPAGRSPSRTVCNIGRDLADGAAYQRGRDRERLHHQRHLVRGRGRGRGRGRAAIVRGSLISATLS